MANDKDIEKRSKEYLKEERERKGTIQIDCERVVSAIEL